MDLLETVGFHAGAIVWAFGESVNNLAGGTWGLVSETAPKRASEGYYATRDAVDEYVPGLGAVIGGAAAPVSYLLNITVIPAGEAIGNGAGAVVYGKRAEDVALGVTSIIGGIGSTCAIFTGIFAPRPIISVPSLQVSGLGELALVPVASVEVAGVASAAGTAGAAVLNGGIITMFADEAKNAWDELFDKYGAELLKDSRQRSTDAVYVRVSPREKAIVKAFAKETGLDMTTILRIALKFLRDKVRPSG